MQDARKKGQVAKAQDLPSAFTFVASFAATLAMVSYLYNSIGGFLRTLFGSIGGMDLPQVIQAGYLHGIFLIFTSAIPILAITSFVGVVVSFLSVGPVFSVEVFKPDIKKFNPVDNLKQKFKMKTLVELIKSILKLSLAGYVVYSVVYKSLPTLIKTVSMPIENSLLVFNHFLVEVVSKLWVLFIVIAVADFIYQKMDFAKQMKMEKFEVKQEYKNTEGDPLIKGKRKQIAQEIAYQEGPAGAVKKAKAVVTNPTHLAIVIGYEREVDAAPYILAMAQDKLADQVIKLADQYDVPVMRNVPLARKLWEEGELYQYVPEDTYEILAEILRWVQSLQDETELETLLEN